MRFVAVMSLCLILAACTRQAQETDNASGMPPEATGIMNTQPAGQPSPSEVLAEVNGTKITRGQAMLALQQAHQQGRQNMNLNDAVQMLVANTLILAEMDRMKIDVTDEELAAEREVVAKTVPEGFTLETFMQKQGVSEEFLKRALQNRIKTRKFLEAKGASTKVTDEEYDQYVTRYNAMGMPEEERAAKKKQLEGIRQQIIDGADFAKMAEEHSDCPSGKRAGGDLGSFGRGQMAPEFEAAAFGQATNEIGPVIETKFGYHIVQVLEKKGTGEKKEDGVAVPEHVRARHILLMARKAPDLPDKQTVVAMLEGRKANAAFGNIVRDLKSKAIINYIGMEPEQPQVPRTMSRPSVQPMDPKRMPPPEGVRIHTSPPQRPANKTVTSRPVAAPKPARQPVAKTPPADQPPAEPAPPAE